MVRERAGSKNAKPHQMVIALPSTLLEFFIRESQSSSKAGGRGDLRSPLPRGKILTKLSVPSLA
jgi:hypothetical protein